MKSPGDLRKLFSLAGRLVLALALLGSSALAAIPVFADSTISPGPLQVTQITGGPAVVNQALTFTISVTNTTTGVASGVLLGDTPPTGMTITALLGPGGNPDLCVRAKTGAFSCTMGDLGPGASATLSFTGTPTVVGSETNSAVAQGCVGLSAVPAAGVTCTTAGGLFVTNAAPLVLQVLATAPAPTPATVPAAPTTANAVAGNAQASVSWVPPLSNGGSAITSYTVTSSPAGATATVVAPATTATLTGLTNGTAYTFSVTATNSVGTSAASAPSNSVTPAAPIVLTAPGAPTGVSATAGNAQATVGWIAPLSDGGSPITAYTVSVATANGVVPATPITATVAAPTTSATITGLTNGTAYTFTVTATNAVGTSPASLASASVTPVAPATAPSAPTRVTATAGNASASVSWTVPLSDGGSALTSYTVTSSPAGGSVTVAAPATSATVTGLTNGTAYTFTVTATNAVGTSPASAPSNSITPVAPLAGAIEPKAPAGSADIQVTGFASNNQPSTGSSFTYVFQVKNNGDSTATNVTLTDVLPAGETYVSNNAGCSQSGGKVTCNVGTLARGASWFVSINVKAPTTPGTYVDTASVTEANFDPRLSNNTFGVTVEAR